MQPRLIPAIIAHHIHLEALVESPESACTDSQSASLSALSSRARSSEARLLTLPAQQCRERVGVNVSLQRPLRDTLGSTAGSLQRHGHRIRAPRWSPLGASAPSGYSYGAVNQPIKHTGLHIKSTCTRASAIADSNDAHGSEVLKLNNGIPQQRVI